MTKTYHPCPMYRPEFVMETDDVSMTIAFRDAFSGFSATFDAATHKLVAHTRQANRIAIQPALELESRYVRRSAPISVLMSGDGRDTTKAAGATGGGRRTFLSVAFERAVLGRQDGLDALYTWACDQGNRPKAWLPFRFKYDGYFGTLLGSGWKCDKQDADGWAIFRADHLESAPLFGGAAVGEDMALAQFCLLLAWVSRTFYNANNATIQQGWHGSRQPRAMGWVPWFFARACFLGFDSADPDFVADFLGATPKTILKALVDDLSKRPPRIGEQTKPDDRTMVDLRDGSGEIVGEYPWQWAILFAAAGWIDRSGLLTSQKWRNFVVYLRGVAADVWERSIGPGGVTYAYSASTDLTQAQCDRANLLETDKSHVYELVDGVIRDRPRMSDAEMTAGAIGLLESPQHPQFQHLLGLLPAPSNMAKYDDLARYMDPAMALLEAGTVP